MKKAISFIRNSHPEIYKGLLFLVALISIVYMFPKQGKFKYELTNLKGKPWIHENLLAPFDFSILKTAAELSQEKETITGEIKPYFKQSISLSNEQIEKFNTAFELEWTKKHSEFKARVNHSKKEKNLRFGNKLLIDIYQKGIIQPNSYIDKKSSDFSIYLLANNIADEHILKDFYTINSAHKHIQKELKKYQKVYDVELLLTLLENSITHSVLFDEGTTTKELEQALGNISSSYDVIVREQAIISTGEIVNSKKYQILTSLKSAYENQAGGTSDYIAITIGQTVIVSFCILILILFLSLFRKDIFRGNTNITFIFALIILEVLMTKIPMSFPSISFYLLPFCILPVIIRSFFDTRIALFVHLTGILIVSFVTPNPFEFIFIQLIGGIVVIFSIINMHKRSQLFISSALLFLTYSCTFISLNIIHTGGLDNIEPSDFAWFAISSSLILFSYPLIYVFEKTFGFISDVSILELSDTNGRLLRELASKAPGTFQHSLQVANLAEEAIYSIGGNALLVRTGALYHDIGKIESPLFFIENQSNQINPHDDLNYDDSAKIIIDHVIKGIEIAKKNNLPEQIIDFIRTHHGTSITAYFYNSYKNDFPEEEIEMDDFRYPGPIPFSKETAVLMMADAVEAASRSLKIHNAESISNLVDGIINTQMDQQQFLNADITFKNINTIRKIFKKKLMNIYHVRVEYPR